jgi:hypothetical protein
MDSSNKSPSIPSISSLHDEKNTKEKTRNDMFTMVLNKCIEKIIYTNRHTDKTFVIFEVPRILIGFPSYDMNSCIVFLLQKLSKNNYYVEFIEPFYLYIDWGSSPNKPNKSQSSSNTKNKTLTFNEDLIKKTLNAPKIEFVYEDLLSGLKKKKKKKKIKK